MPDTYTTGPMLLTLAQEGGMLSEDSQALPTATEGAGAPTSTGAGGFGSPIILIGMFALVAMMIFTSMSASRKEKKQREAMMNSLGKHDKVQTVGGLIGSIVELKGDEVLLRVDEASNTRVRIARTAVSKVLHSASNPSSESAVADA
ncbi:MAG: preprotein translocase subunit YajC [Phycisphaerales bacterium JB059]